MKHNVLKTVLLFRNAYEDTSWSCIALHASDGFNSVQEMIEAISKAFKKAIDTQCDEYWGHCWCCPVSRRTGLDKCKECGKDSKKPDVTREDVEKIIDGVFTGTMQNLGESWECLQEEGIESFGFRGEAGQIVSLYNGPELIVNTIFDGFNVDNKELMVKCSSVRLYKEK